MPIDPNILLQSQPSVQVQSPMDVMTKGLTLKHLAMQNQASERELADQQAVRDAYKGNLTVGADGTPTLDRSGFMSNLAQSNPVLAMQKGQELQTQDTQSREQKLKLFKDQIEAQHGITMSMTPDNYQNVRAQAIAMGLPNSANLPEAADAGTIRQMQMNTMSMKDKLDEQFKQMNYDQKDRELGLKHEENSIKRDQLNTDKVDKYTKDMKKDLDADAGRTGNFGQISAKVQAADRLNTLIAQYKDGNLPEAQKEELALGMANMISPSSGGSREQINALVPHSMVGDANKSLSYILNMPRGSGQESFIQNMQDTVNRERDTANSQLNSIRASRLSAHNTLRRMSPDAYNAVLQSYGMDPSKVSPNGQYQASPGTGVKGVMSFDQWKAQQGGQ